MKERFIYEEDYPVVQTKAGKLRGYVFDEMFIFQGIKYADAKRWQMPGPVEPWEGIRDATSYGPVCPTIGNPIPMGEVYIPHRFWPADEHCQYLNIWTTSLDTASKKPVMVWFHGGGFSDGSSVEQVAYEGDALAKYGDVVSVTINHRLNMLGFLDMSSFGEEYKNSGNVGLADIVAALQWVQDNIAAFGGDPDNVTVFGQSGGGGKVQALLQIPAAAGLFHKGILMSGVHKEPRDQVVDHHKLVCDMMELLHIDPSHPEEFAQVPYQTLEKVYNRASYSLLKQGIFNSWGPVQDDWYLGDYSKVGFAEHAKTIPIIVGTVMAEFSDRNAYTHPERMTEEEKLEEIRNICKEQTDKAVTLFRSAYPTHDITRILQMDLNSRDAAVCFAGDKAAASSAPSYVYLFTPEFRMKGQTPAWHCADIPFVFHNTERCPYTQIPGVTARLEEEMCGAWVAFARTGNPNHPALKEWPSFTKENPATMVFDETSEAKTGHDTELITTLQQVIPKRDISKMFLKMALKAGEESAGKAWLY